MLNLSAFVEKLHKGKNKGKKSCNIQEKLSSQAFLVKNYNTIPLPVLYRLHPFTAEITWNTLNNKLKNDKINKTYVLIA